MSERQAIERQIDAMNREQQHLSWFAGFFYPRALRERLNAFSRNRGNEELYRIYEEPIPPIGFFQRLFFPSLRQFSDSSVIQCCRLLKTTSLLTPTNFSSLLNTNQPDSVEAAIFELKQSGVLAREDAQDYLSAVFAYIPPPDRSSRAVFARALSSLHKSNLLTSSNRDKVMGHTDPVNAIYAVIDLNKHGLLSGTEAQANLDEALNHRKPYDVAYAFSALHNNKLLTPANRRTILELDRYGYINMVSIFLRHLDYDTDLLSGESAQINFDTVIMKLQRSRQFDFIIAHHHASLFRGPHAQANFDALKSHRDPEVLAEAIGALDKYRLLNDANRRILAVHTDPARVTEALGSISKVRQIDFERLIEHGAILLVPDAWSRIPPRRKVTRQEFEQIITIASAHSRDPAAGQAALRDYIDVLIVGVRARRLVANQRDLLVNHAQSTHTASVHQSASKSATKLKSHYGSTVSTRPEIEAILDSLSAWLKKQSNPSSFTQWFARPSHKLEAAKRGLDRIRHPDFNYTDTRSGVSTRELVALLWVAINDETKRTGSLKDAQQCMIEALYESQREYNLSAAGIDNVLLPDSPACAGGTFNKFIEKFTGIHNDVELLMITQESATLKFQALVKSEALAHLKQLQSDGKIDDLSRLLGEIMASDNENAAGPLWDAIAERVADKLFEEFKSLYGDDKNNTHFQALLGTGEYVTLPVESLEALRRAIHTVSASTPVPPEAPTSTITPRPSQAGFFSPSGAADTPEDNGAGVGLGIRRSVDS